MFRSGIAPLNVELGRWTGKPFGECMCPYCNNQIEDEIHLFRCPRYLHLCDSASDRDAHRQHPEEALIALLGAVSPVTFNSEVVV